MRDGTTCGPDRASSGPRWGLAAKALVAALLVAALCSAVNLGEATAALERARPLPLATALAASVLGVLVSAEKWRGLLRQAGVGLTLAACARLYWVGMFASNLLPTSVGGDAARLLLTPAPGRRAAVAGSILVERLTGFLVMLALCTLGLALRPQYFDEPGLRATFLAGVLVLDLGVVAALLAPGRLAPLLSGLAGRLPAALRRRPMRRPASPRRSRASPGTPAVLARAMALSAVFYGTIIVAQHAVLRAAGAEVALAEVALVAAVVPLAAMLPVSLNGLGVAEGVFVLLYAQLGVAPEAALAAAVLRRLVDLANSGLGGPLWLALRDGGGQPAVGEDPPRLGGARP
jgi:uncharacterized membrane protein YbhN (UPF0104 family)